MKIKVVYPDAECVWCGHVGCVRVKTYQGRTGPLCEACYLESRSEGIPSVEEIRREAELIRLERWMMSLDVNGGFVECDDKE